MFNKFLLSKYQYDTANQYLQQIINRQTYYLYLNIIFQINFRIFLYLTNITLLVIDFILTLFSNNHINKKYLSKLIMNRVSYLTYSKV